MSLTGLEELLKLAQHLSDDKKRLEVQVRIMGGEIDRLNRENRDLRATLDQACEFGGNPIV